MIQKCHLHNNCAFTSYHVAFHKTSRDIGRPTLKINPKFVRTDMVGKSLSSSHNPACLHVSVASAKRQTVARFSYYSAISWLPASTAYLTRGLVTKSDSSCASQRRSLCRWIAALRSITIMSDLVAPVSVGSVSATVVPMNLAW